MGTSEHTSKPAVLIICSDPTVRQWVEHCSSLVRWRFEVIETAEEAVRRTLESNLDLILVDLALPNLDGYDVYALIRSHEHSRLLPDVPVIAIAENVAAKERARILSAGFFDLLRKPLKPELIEDVYLRADALRFEIHRNRHSVDCESIIAHTVKALSWRTDGLGSVTGGIALTLETFCSDLLYRVLLATYSGEFDDAASHATRLGTLAKDIGANHLSALCALLASGLRDSEKKAETMVVLAKAELDRIIFCLREEAFSRGTQDIRTTTFKR